MKKASIFSKKFVSWLLSVSIIAGTLACLSTTTLFAATETPTEALKHGVLSKVTYDFTSEFNYTSYKSNSNGSILADPADETNNCFAITGGSYQSYALCLPYTIDNNSKYRISYDIKAESGTTIVNNYETTGIRVTYAADGKNVQNNQEMNANGLTSASLHKYLWGTKKEAAAYPTVWTKQSIEISTGESEIIGDRNTLAFFVRFNKADGKIYLDNIVIEKLDPNVGFYDFEEGIEITNYKLVDNKIPPEVISTEDASGKTTNVLKFDITNYQYTGVVFPFEMVKGATYEISYNYKSTVAGAKLLNNGVYADIEVPTGVPKVKLSPFIDSNGTNQVADTAWKTRTFKVTADNVTDVNKYLAIALQGNANSGTPYVYLDNVKIRKIDPNLTEYDFDNEAPGIKVKKPNNMGSTAVSVIPEPNREDNKVLEIKVIKNALKGIGVDFDYVLESNTKYKISYKYRSDGNFTIQYEADKYYQSGFFPDTFASQVGGFEDNANKIYPVGERLAKFRDGTGNDTISTSWTEVTRTFTTGTVDASKKYLSLVIHSAINKNVDYSSLYLDDLVIEKVVDLTFNTDDGEAIEPVTARIGSKVVLPTPQKLGYTFSGWYDADNKLIGNASEEIPCPAENTTYYAKWILVGDVDENEIIDNSDFVMLKQILLGIKTYDKLELTDCSGDGIVNILDLVALKKILMTASV